jgi:hypothetical protein
MPDHPEFAWVGARESLATPWPRADWRAPDATRCTRISALAGSLMPGTATQVTNRATRLRFPRQRL